MRRLSRRSPEGAEADLLAERVTFYPLLHSIAMTGPAYVLVSGIAEVAEILIPRFKKLRPTDWPDLC